MRRFRNRFRLQPLSARPAANDVCWDAGMSFALYAVATLVLSGVAVLLALG
jgi:hypothetical protein